MKEMEQTLWHQVINSFSMRDRVAGCALLATGDDGHFGYVVCGHGKRDRTSQSGGVAVTAIPG
jgi:hypothetical protein